jgi:hypothetical protein
MYRAMRGRAETRCRVVVSIADVKIVGIGVLISDLRLPQPRREERIVLDAQTGRRESNGLSTLARRRSRYEKRGRKAQKKEEPAGHCESAAVWVE